MIQNTNYLLYGWEMIELNNKKILIRIPACVGIERQLFSPPESISEYLGVPIVFADFDQCQYLEKGKECKIWTLNKKLNDLDKSEYFLNELSKSYEINFALWNSAKYEPMKFPIITQCWKNKRFSDYKKYYPVIQTALFKN